MLLQPRQSPTAAAIGYSPVDPGAAMADIDTQHFLTTADAFSAELESLPDEKKVIAKVNRHLMPLFFSLSLLCSLDRANLSFAALQLNKDLGFSKEVYGFGSGVFFLGYACFQIPATLFCARIGAPLFLGVSLACWGVVASCFATLQSSTQFFILRFILGLCETGAYPGMWYHMHLFFNDQELGVGYATVSTATAVNGVIGGPIAAALLSLDGFAGLRGWQWLFLLEGVPAVVLGGVLWKRLARSPTSAGFLSQQERAWLQRRQAQAQQDREADEERGAKAGEPERWWHFARQWRIWYLALIWTLVTTAMDGLVFWVPTIISSVIYLDDDEDDGDESARHEETEHAAKSALLSAIPFGCAAITMVMVARHSKAARERHLHGAIPLVIAGLGFTLLPLAGPLHLGLR
ncbi:hypothetical protein WJX73_006048 [Symbiochloris irregularis]|uniref:Major facilitator superfamily (MFS) profile domain-containing protein n=1 Tax=Symbiochloris irregularis TaxID=706552 RepID=A0AAW1P767_9CHLO